MGRIGTRHLVITCADADDSQFRGVAQACRLLAERAAVRAVAWQGGPPLRLRARRALRWVAVSGHGAVAEAQVGDGRGCSLTPRDLALGPAVDLYLLACYQGGEAVRLAWAEETRATVHGCEGETESALSTLFLLALLEHGPESAPLWFDRWRDANDRLRPYFPAMRALYEARGRDFGAALEAIAGVVDLGAFGDIVAVARRHAPILSGLG